MRKSIVNSRHSVKILYTGYQSTPKGVPASRIIARLGRKSGKKVRTPVSYWRLSHACKVVPHGKSFLR